ncbi:MAG: hypothetical protein ACR2NG_05510 [Acidimicrobiia bacterium]
MVRRLGVLFVLAVMASACVPGQDAAPETVPSTSTTQPTVSGAIGDRLVVATGSGAVAVFDGDLVEVQRITPTDGTIFRQPAWLDGESVVFSEVPGTGGQSALTSAAVADGSIRWRAELDTVPFYYLPAPSGAGADTTSLRNNPQGGIIAELIATGGAVEQISDRSPFYSSWSPDGSALAIHERQSRLSIVEGSRVTTIAEPSGAFQAPAWTEAGLVVLHATAGGQALSVWDGSAFEDLAIIAGPVRFSATDRQIAIQSAEVADGQSVEAGLRTQSLPTIPGGRLVVVDIESGSVATVSNRLVPMFEWSPDGSRLLYASFGDGGSPELTWHLWDEQSTVDLSAFTVQPEWFQAVAPFFDQYVQSVSMWSPSGNRIAYPAVVEGANAVVVEMVDGSGTAMITDAVWASWSSGGRP